MLQTGMIYMYFWHVVVTVTVCTRDALWRKLSVMHNGLLGKYIIATNIVIIVTTVTNIYVIVTNITIITITTNTIFDRSLIVKGCR